MPAVDSQEMLTIGMMGVYSSWGDGYIYHLFDFRHRASHLGAYTS